MIVHGPKFVKRANAWVVSVITENKTKRGTKKQEMNWFQTFEEAEAYAKSKE